MISADEALKRLRDGNRRFIEALRTGASLKGTRPSELPAEQEPIAIILGCSDARVPAELVFDHGLGELFVIRVAGNVVAPSQIGSIEFAAGRFGTRLVVVLGHTGCGAVDATLSELRRPAADQSPNIAAIVARVQPAVEPLIASWSGDDDSLMRAAVRANIRASVDQVRGGSALLKELERDDGLLIVGAEYSLETGDVAFLDAP